MGGIWGVASHVRHAHELTIVEIYNSLTVVEVKKMVSGKY